MPVSYATSSTLRGELLVILMPNTTHQLPAQATVNTRLFYRVCQDHFLDIGGGPGNLRSWDDRLASRNRALPITFWVKRAEEWQTSQGGAEFILKPFLIHATTDGGDRPLRSGISHIGRRPASRVVEHAA